MRPRVVLGVMLSALSCSACASMSGVPDGGPDAGPADAGSPDAGAPGADSGSDGGDAGVGTCPAWFSFPTCAPPGSPDRAWCDAARELTVDAGTVRQDTAAGGFGDCATTASGIGGPSLYFSMTAPAGHYIRFVATGVGFDVRPLVRKLTCGGQAERSNIVSAFDGGVGFCFRNATMKDERVLLAVSRYSGEATCETLVVDVRVELSPDGANCLPSEF